MPSLSSVRHSFPLRNCTEDTHGFSLDVEAAHKTVRVRETEQGLLGVRNRDKLYFYKVCPFGAAFSAFWFQRVSSFLARMLHLLIFSPHALLMYVDDLILFQALSSIFNSAALALAFCAVFNIPISWKKLQFSETILWIGWELNFLAGALRVPDSKGEKLMERIPPMLRGRHVERLCQLYPEQRSWLRCLYPDLHSPLGKFYSVQPGQWQQLCDCLDDSMTFTSVPRNAAVQIGARLLSVRHHAVVNKADLLKVPITCKLVWLRVADPASKRRRLSRTSRALLQTWLDWARQPCIWKSLPEPPAVDLVAAADAMAQNDTFAIGGFLLFQDRRIWFSER